MQPLENSIDSLVVAAPIPLTFDDTFVISVYDEVVSLFTILDEASNEAFKCDSFSPSDISLAIEGLHCSKVFLFLCVSQSKPMYVVTPVKGLSFDNSHGILSCSE